MKIVASDQYEELAIEWQYDMITILKKTLLKHQIAIDKVKEVCGDFAFDLAMLQDQGGLQLGDKKFRPVICFEDDNLNLHYGSKEHIQLHDYAYGSTDEAFEK